MWGRGRGRGGADIEGELNLAALVEALADFMLEVTAGGGSSGSNESWYGRGNNTELTVL